MNCDYRGMPITNWRELQADRRLRIKKQKRRQKIRSFFGICRLVMLLVIVASMLLAIHFRTDIYNRNIKNEANIIENLPAS